MANLYREWVRIAEDIGWEHLSEELPISCAMDWANSLHIDTRYLTSPLSLWFYRSGEKLCLEWAPDEDCPAEDWETPQGKGQVPARDFEEACRDFSTRLLSQMGERIGQVRSGVTWPDVTIVIENLLGEQEYRSGWMEDAFLRVTKAAPERDWERIREALRIAGLDKTT